MISISKTLIPKSDQLNGDDLMAGPRTFTISAAAESADPDSDQPIELTLAEWIRGRPYKPGLSMRRVMYNAWGDDAETYVGKRFTLFRDPSVRFGGMDVGGIRISHMSDLPGGRQLKSALTVTRGKKDIYVVKPLVDEPHAPQASPEPSAVEVAAATDRAELSAMWKRSGPERKAQIEARVQALTEEGAES